MKSQKNSLKHWSSPRNAVVIIIGALLVLLLSAAVVIRTKEQASNNPAGKLSTITPTQKQPQFTISDSDIPEWNRYTNNLFEYSIDVPASWPADINEDMSALKRQDLDFNLCFNPVAHQSDRYIGSPKHAALYINFPVSVKGPHSDVGKRYEGGLSGLEEFYGKPDSRYVSIDGKKVFIAKSTSAVNKPTGVHGEWCSGCSSKYVFIDFGNGKILTITGTWGKDRSDFESLFDSAISSLKFYK